MFRMTIFRGASYKRVKTLIFFKKIAKNAASTLSLRFYLYEEQDQMSSHEMIEVFYRWHAILNQGEISYFSSARCKPIDLNKCILCQKK